jgi:hypothetical protein
MKSWILVMLAACAASPIPAARFANAPPVQRVDDRQDVPQKPEKRPYTQKLSFVDGHVYEPMRRVLSLEQSQRALGINSIDEVPDSTWFTNRIGARTITPDEIRAAPGGVGSPERFTPWTIHSTKVGGMSVGFIVTDTRGEKFIVKFDDPGHAEAETGAQIVSGKLLWACGYNVSEDYIAYVRREDLILAPDAVSEDVFGGKRELDTAEVTRKLALVDRGADGRFRTMVSHLIDGKPLGGHSAVGTRPDDPNDVIPHERRRDLRGARAIFAWLDHDDIQEGQFLDVWVEDPLDPKRHFVKHYFLDYGLSLGVMASVTRNLRRSYEYYVDPGRVLDSLTSLGFQDRPWSRRKAPHLRGLGVFEVDAFRPGDWKPLGPTYVPLVTADRFDNYWGAKILMRFTRDQLRAAVEGGRYSDRRVVDYLIDALIARQRAVGQYWFSRVNPLEQFAAIDDDGLCFDDLTLVYGFAPASTTKYTVTLHARDGRAFSAPVRLTASAGGRTCAKIQLARGADAYTIIRVDTARPSFAGTTFVHVARAPGTGTPRVIGLWRD